MDRLNPKTFEPIFLIAVPQLKDPNFTKSVILIIQNDSEGALGIVINHPIDISFAKFADSQEIVCHDSLKDQKVFKGGPVETERGWLLHRDDSVREKQEVVPGVYMSGSGETLKTLFEEGVSPFRLYLGYSGWDHGQLEQEMIRGSWITTKADMKYVFETPSSEVWETILSDMGVDPNRLMMGTGIH